MTCLLTFAYSQRMTARMSRRRNLLGEVVFMDMNCENLAFFRKKAHLSFGDLAKRLAELGHPVSRSHLHDIEHGRRKPSALLAEAIATALEVPLSAFASEEIVA